MCVEGCIDASSDFKTLEANSHSTDRHRSTARHFSDITKPDKWRFNVQSVKTSADQQQQPQSGENTDPTKCLLLLLVVCEVAFKGKFTPHRQTRTIPRLHYATSLKDTNRCHYFHDVCAVNRPSANKQTTAKNYLGKQANK